MRTEHARSQVQLLSVTTYYYYRSFIIIQKFKDFLNKSTSDNLFLNFYVIFDFKLSKIYLFRRVLLLISGIQKKKQEKDKKTKKEIHHRRIFTFSLWSPFISKFTYVHLILLNKFFLF